jgi:asparagine synthase (glutamine-hydrolysing)
LFRFRGNKMCGIAGVVGNLDKLLAKDGVKKMLSALARRGPDGEGVEIWNNAVLGHRRLAIFDLSDAGRQPMMSPDRSVGVVFNGAIYNYRELQKELNAHGYHFQSKTDTEVLIHGYQNWGLDSLVSRLQGMFAFGLWDEQIQTLYLVRDRLGVKPLAYCIDGPRIAFASTVRALRAADYLEELDATAVAEFLRFGFVLDSQSIYQGAVKVPAASIVEWSNQRLKTREYWTPPAADASKTISFPETLEETERLFLRAVELRLRADVPVGSLLSAGIDSSLVCWATAKLGNPVTAYTIGTSGDLWDESAGACATARRLNIPHSVIEISDIKAPAIEDLVEAYAEPFACASALGMLEVSRAVASSSKVLLTGDGGDDVFLGYPRHRNLWFATKLAQVVPDSVKNAWLSYSSTVPRVAVMRRLAALFDYTAGGLPGYLKYKALLTCPDDGILGDRLVSINHATAQRSGYSSNACDLILDQFLEYERETSFLGEYMPKVDGATMHYGLEARCPFLDHHLWEFAATLPFDIRLHRGRLKAILREIARKHIGANVANRRKLGFGIPVHRWMVGRWRPVLENAFRYSYLEQEGWIRPNSMLAQLKLAVEKGSASNQLWYLFVLESWMKYEHSLTKLTPAKESR